MIKKTRQQKDFFFLSSNLENKETKDKWKTLGKVNRRSMRLRNLLPKNAALEHEKSYLVYYLYKSSMGILLFFALFMHQLTQFGVFQIIYKQNSGIRKNNKRQNTINFISMQQNRGISNTTVANIVWGLSYCQIPQTQGYNRGLIKQI